MRTYVSRRVLTLAPVVLGVTFAVFIMLHLMPVDPVMMMITELSSGQAPVQLTGTSTRGDAITSDANGLGTTTTTEGDLIVGWALQSGVAGDLVAVLTQPCYYAS